MSDILIAEAATILGRSRSWVSKQAANGVITGAKVAEGNTPPVWRLDRKSVETVAAKLANGGLPRKRHQRKPRKKEKQYITAEQAAKFAKVSKSTISRLALQGKIDRVRHGRVDLYDREDVLKATGQGEPIPPVSRLMPSSELTAIRKVLENSHEELLTVRHELMRTSELLADFIKLYS